MNHGIATGDLIVCTKHEWITYYGTNVGVVVSVKDNVEWASWEAMPTDDPRAPLPSCCMMIVFFSHSTAPRLYASRGCHPFPVTFFPRDVSRVDVAGHVRELFGNVEVWR